MVNPTGKANPDNAKALPRIKSMAAAGHSYGAIALAVGMSRNRVIGLARRNGISNGNPLPEELTEAGQAKAADRRREKTIAREAKLSAAQREMRARKAEITAQQHMPAGAETSVAATGQNPGQPAGPHAVLFRGAVMMKARNERIAAQLQAGRRAEDLAQEYGLSPVTIRGIGTDLGVRRRVRGSVAPAESDCYPSAWGCQWIAGDPKQHDGDIDALKCNAPRVPGRPYCNGHCLRAYNAAALPETGADTGATEAGSVGGAA